MLFTNPTAQAVHEALTRASSTNAWRTYEGPNLAQLRTQLSQLFQREHVRLCCSGTFGIELAIRSLKLPPDSEVILAGYDFPGNFRAIQDAGANVVLCDIQADNWVTSVEQISCATGPRTKAIIVSHLHGKRSPIQQISLWAKENGLYLIEDACQEPAIPLEASGFNESLSGSCGDLSVISFGGSKVLSAGRGGAVMTNDARLAQRMTIFCERGNDAFALSEIQAIVLGPQVERLQADNRSRSFAAADLSNKLSHIDWLRFGPGNTLPAAFYKLGMSVTPKLLERSQVQHIVRNIQTPNTEPLSLARDLVVSELVKKGISIGPGFPGFASRSSNRCRRVPSLDHCHKAAHATLVLGHQHLLDPNTGDNSIDAVVAKILELDAEIAI